MGPGRLGQAMGRLLARADRQVRFLAARKLPHAQRAVRFVGDGRAVRLDDPALAEAATFLITVSDSALESVAKRLATLDFDWHGKVVLHTCGSLSSSILNPLEKRGAAIGALHPFQTVPSPAAGVRNLIGCYWCVEGDARARKTAERWVKTLHGISFRLPSSKKPAYHTAAFLTCPAVTTLMEESSRILKRIGVPRRIIRPMLAQFVTETARNFGELGGRRALTGPAVRGDWETLARHVTALQRIAPKSLPLYRQLVATMLRVAGKRKSGLARPVI